MSIEPFITVAGASGLSGCSLVIFHPSEKDSEDIPLLVFHFLKQYNNRYSWNVLNSFSEYSGCPCFRSTGSDSKNTDQKD
ncbi:MAG: hypothetical protein DRP70_08405 [Spirochaetes bacterium]|nr:MAG: hypothetical protein DRP70_08405 [Spirochaetota bacterium]